MEAVACYKRSCKLNMVALGVLPKVVSGPLANSQIDGHAIEPGRTSRGPCSSSAFLFATGEHKWRNPANLPDASKSQLPPSWLVGGWPGTFHISHELPGGRVLK